MFDLNDLTGREIALIEELSGTSISTMGDPEKLSSKTLYAMFLVQKRKAGEKDFTFNKALDHTLREVIDSLGFNVEPDEEEGKDES